MGTTRRDFLRTGALAAGAVGLARCDGAGDGAAAELVAAPWLDDAPDEALFAHGVASGDPDAESVVLWTRVSDQDGEVEVRWIVATDPSFDPSTVVGEGTTTTSSERDFTVKPIPTGLAAGTTHYYAFFVGDRRSVVGRTRTADDGPVGALSFAVCSCAKLEDGWFTGYARVAERADLAGVIHLGDYIYEYAGQGGLRAPRPSFEIVSLGDYRSRYASYREDPDLQAAHRQHPWMLVWDDHEITNDAWRDGAQNHQRDEGGWEARKAAAVQAWVEWMPVRTPDPADPYRIWRRIRFGDLADVFLIDTRLYGRDEQIPDATERLIATDPVINDPARQLLGEAQESWLIDGLTTSTTRWRLIGNQLPFAHWKRIAGSIAEGGGYPKDSGDKWDGYNACRKRILDAIEAEGVDGVCIVTGDIHRAQAIEVSQDPDDDAVYDPETGEGALAVELVTTSVATSGSQDEAGHELDDALQRVSLLGPNRHHKMVDSRRGYLLVHLREDALVGEFWAVDTRERNDEPPVLRHKYRVAAGTASLGSDLVDEGPEPLPAAPPLATD